ncbi:hypothetical protein NONO_c68810 [Nocardia nova SH22a]|uniref:Uncharacterized protein n=1 Tax=Nocardia nova SH22a TaxID=1415166 RepID=W5TRT0_9NOCA|nr:hypothetical protein [Nocardia nova]AHH21648.1 hypothetical protein NONO_c68810 [Nocardia nova SH22a]
MTRSEEDSQSRADTTGYAAPGSEHYGLRWDSGEFEDPRSGSTPAVLPSREKTRGHDESLAFGGYSDEDAGGVFGPAPGGSATDIPSYKPDYLTGTAVSSGNDTATPASGSALPVRDSAASLGAVPQLPRREPAPPGAFASSFAAEFDRAATGTPEPQPESIVDESAPTSSFAATPPVTDTPATQQEDTSQDAEDTIRRIAESLGIDTDKTGRSRADAGNQPTVGNHDGVIGASASFTTDADDIPAADNTGATESAKISAAPTPDPLKLPLRTPTPAYGLARTDTDAPEPGSTPPGDTPRTGRRLPAAAAAAAQRTGDATANLGTTHETTTENGSALPTRLPHRHSNEPVTANSTITDPAPSSEDTASFPVVTGGADHPPVLAARTRGRNGTADATNTSHGIDPGDSPDTDVLRRRTSETSIAQSDSPATPFTLPRRGSDAEPAETTSASEYAAPRTHSSLDQTLTPLVDNTDATPTSHSATGPTAGETGPATDEPDTGTPHSTPPRHTSGPAASDTASEPAPRRNRRAAPDHAAGESAEDIASRAGIAPTSRRAARRRAETSDAPALDVSVIMQLLLASHNLENVARNAEAGDVSLEDFITAAHRTRAAAVELVTNWFGGTEQMREFAQALLAATES